MMTPTRKAKLIWRCRRGMLELDLLLQRFVAQYLDQLTESELARFEALLESPDPDLYAWLMGSDKPENKQYDSIIALIQMHSGVF